MNLTEPQKKAFVPLSVSTAVFVLCDEVLFRSNPTRKGRGAVDSRTWLAAGMSGIATMFLYDKAEPTTKGDIEKYALPVGGGAAAFIAVNRFAMPKLKPGVDARPYAAGAAALAAWYVNKDVSPSPVVGRLAERTFKAPFPPPFGPPFPPEFEG